MDKYDVKALRFLGKGLLFVLKIPYYIIYYPVKWIVGFGKEVSEHKREDEIMEKRKSMVPKYEEFKVVQKTEGDYSKWLENVFKSDSKIGIILGARGSGKTAFGMKLLENMHVKSKKECFAMGFDEKELPSWIKGATDISQIKNNSFVLIDEGGILFNSRSAMSSANKLLSSLMLIARHKNISIIFISQNSSNLEVNILRQADFLALKPSSLLQKDFERKIIQKIYESMEKDFKKFKSERGITYIHSDSFTGFVSNPLPSFWKETISKSFK